MECALETATLISTCRRLLTTLGTDEARAAVHACDVWLEKRQRSTRLARLTSHPPPEVLHAILRTVDPDGRKQTYLACSLMNKSWQQVAWSLFWKEVKVSRRFSLTKFHHPRTLKLMGSNLRSLKAEDQQWWEFPVGPMMAGLRMIDLAYVGIMVEDLISLFEHLPNLVSLRVRLEGGISDDEEESSDGSGEEGELGQDDRRVGVWKDYPPGSEQIWRQGFARLKALNIVLGGGPVPQDIVMGMADSLGPNLESLHVRVGVHAALEGPEGAMNSIIHKVAANCPNLKDFAPKTMRMGPIRHLLESRPPLLYLSLSDVLPDEIFKQIAFACTNLIYLRAPMSTSFWYLAQGPFLRGCKFIDVLDTDMARSGLHGFLKHRGHKLEGFSLTFDLIVGGNPGDGVVDHLIDYAPNLKELHITAVTEGGVLKLLRASGKLKRLYLKGKLLESDKIHAVAAERNVFVPDPKVLERVPYPSEILAFPSYVEVMKDSWIGM
ncbi:hypothetical protein HK104_010502 [Borealophlyctis nickersoniae]|nr:hypothetical protein HK104_010502 [Borealophlyctis nickersoniae]